MCGIATLTTVVSITDRNAPSSTDAATTHLPASTVCPGAVTASGSVIPPDTNPVFSLSRSHPLRVHTPIEFFSDLQKQMCGRERRTSDQAAHACGGVSERGINFRPTKREGLRPSAAWRTAENLCANPLPPARPPEQSHSTACRSAPRPRDPPSTGREMTRSAPSRSLLQRAA